MLEIGSTVFPSTTLWLHLHDREFSEVQSDLSAALARAEIELERCIIERASYRALNGQKRASGFPYPGPQSGVRTEEYLHHSEDMKVYNACCINPSPK